LKLQHISAINLAAGQHVLVGISLPCILFRRLLSSLVISFNLFSDGSPFGNDDDAAVQFEKRETDKQKYVLM